MKYIYIFLFFTSISGINAQNNEIKNTINKFFEGLQNGDTITINKVIHEDLTLQTTYTNKEGKNLLKNETKKEFLTSVAAKNEEDIWLEKLISFSINVDANLATVWTPYEFYFNNSLSHCGVNSFQLFNDNGHWKIISIVDTRRREGCE